MRRGRALLTAVLLSAGLAPSSLWAGALVRVAPESVVRGDEILLSDLATIEGDAASVARLRGLRLGPAPAPGAAQQLDADYLRLRLRQAPADAARVELSLPERIAVTRAAQVLPAAAIVEAAQREGISRLEALDRDGGPHALTPASRPGDLLVPTGRVDLVTRIQPAAPPYAYLAAVVTVRVDGRDYQSVPLSFRVGRLQSVVVAARDLEPRATPVEGDFRLETRPSSGIPQNAVFAMPSLRDVELTRALRPGEILTDGVLRPKLLVRRGELVTLVVEGQGFRITTVGQAGEDARRGEPVRVVNPTSKREVIGRAAGPGLVRVPAGGAGSGR